MEAIASYALPHEPIRVILVSGLTEILHLNNIEWGVKKRVPLLLLGL
jgi:hypothetical protein